MHDMYAYMYIRLVFKMHSYDRCVSYIPKIIIESMCVCVYMYYKCVPYCVASGSLFLSFPISSTYRQTYPSQLFSAQD